MDYSRRFKPCVESEIGKLDYVMLHAPGREIENMTPENAHEFLFSDILNLNEAANDYKNFQNVLKKITNVLYFDDLLKAILQDTAVKESLIDQICEREGIKYLSPVLKDKPADTLVKIFIEGLECQGLKERFIIKPIPNLFFTRDASLTMYDNVMICKMATEVRDRETMLLDAIFRHSPIIDTEVIHPVDKYDPKKDGTFEGGDIQIASENVILSGCGLRTNRHGIDSLIEHLKTKGGTRHLILQELPTSPESFIHLDMVFTFLDKDKCMCYKPVIMNNAFKTIHFEINGKEPVKVTDENSLLNALKKVGMDLEPIFCGSDDEYTMAREQWHSGANFFCFEPGKVLGYARNIHTIENLAKHGFEVLPAADVADGKLNVDDYKQCVVTFQGNELSRGGGGARCMTMPLLRQKVI